MNDSWIRFWERLVVDWVSVLVTAFVAQGLWFGLGSLWVDFRPESESQLTSISAKLGFPWLFVVVLGLLWGVQRAIAARKSIASRR